VLVHTLRMGQSAEAGRRMTLEEWSELDEDVEGELVDGRLEEEEMPTFFHEAIVSFLVGALRAWLVPRGGTVLASEAKIAVSPGRGRKPDVVVYFPGTPLPSRRASMSKAAPDLVIEVVSPTPRDQRRDRIEKKAEYLALGVRQYWLVDAANRTLEVLAREDGRVVELLAAAEGAHPIPGCDGLVVDLDAMWAEADRFPDED
jgi:Uma2 family endonuclease